MARLEKALEPTTWVLDGNYDRTRAIKWPRATMVIWLDLPYWQVLWQVFTRTMKRSLTQEKLWSGNQESFERHFFLATLFCSGQSPIFAISAGATSVLCSRPITHTFTGSAFVRVVIFSVCFPMSRRWVTVRSPAVWLSYEFSGERPLETADTTPLCYARPRPKEPYCVLTLSFKRGPDMPNRFMLAPLTNSQSHEDGVLSDAEHRWLSMRAEGGFGLTMTCAAHVIDWGKGSRAN